MRDLVPLPPIVLDLDEEEARMFHEALRNPPEPSEALKEAFRRHSANRSTSQTIVDTLKRKK